jgi:hypothetical protein
VDDSMIVARHDGNLIVYDLERVMDFQRT